MKRIIVRTTAGMAVATLALACSWDYPVWPKSKKSDAPLFRFVVRERNGTGYIDRNGKIVVLPTLRSFGNQGGDFFDGLASVSMNGEDWYIDSSGKPVFRSDGLGAGDFSEGLATTFRDRKLGYIDRAGRLVIPRTFDSAGPFSEGLAAVSVNGRYGYIGRDGKFAVQPKYFMAMEFSEGAARVVEEGQCIYTGYLPCDSMNPQVLPDGTAFANGMPRCRYSFVDKQGKRLFEGRYSDAKEFSEGFAAVGNKGLWGYVNKKGVEVVPLKYEGAEPFAEGLAAARVNDKWGYIDTAGKMVIPAMFSRAESFSEGTAVVGEYLAGMYWFIDGKGKRAIPGFFTAAAGFVMGLAHVRVGGDYYTAKWSYIDHSGKAVFTYSDQSGSGKR